MACGTLPTFPEAQVEVDIVKPFSPYVDNLDSVIMLIIMFEVHRSTGASLLWCPPLKLQTRKHTPLRREHIWRRAQGPALEVNPRTVLPASDTTAVELKGPLLLAIPPQVALERRAASPA